VHLIDKGVERGDVLYQVTTEFSRFDYIATDQDRQLATALLLLIRAIEDAQPAASSRTASSCPLAGGSAQRFGAMC